MKLTSKKRSFLRKRAHELNAIVRVGKDGYSDTLVQSILDAIGTRELIKIKILQNCEEDKVEIANKIADGTDAEIVGLVGRTVILYKENKEKPSELTLELKRV